MKHPNTHCQICGQPIMANTGVIALHGYKRPGKGWQTGSCFGAKYRPSEVACDTIQLAINDAAGALRCSERDTRELNPPMLRALDR